MSEIITMSKKSIRDKSVY